MALMSHGTFTGHSIQGWLLNWRELKYMSDIDLLHMSQSLSSTWIFNVFAVVISTISPRQDAPNTFMDPTRKLYRYWNNSHILDIVCWFCMALFNYLMSISKICFRHSTFKVDNIWPINDSRGGFMRQDNVLDGEAHFSFVQIHSITYITCEIVLQT